MAISSSRPRIVDFIAWALLAIALIFAVYVRVRLREFPLERDEGEFAYAGQLILQGVPPYKLAYNMKLPGTYIAYAALMAIFGQTTAGIHLGLLAVNIATIVLLYRFVRELFDPFSAGMAAVAYSILSVSPAMLGMAAHATHFVAFFGLAGTYLLWRHLQSGRWWQAFASGLLMGIAFLMKQQGVFLMVFGGGFLLLHGLWLAAYPRKRLPVAFGLYSLAAVLPYGLICFWLWRAGVWDKFWFWTVEYASKYVQNIPLSLAWTSLRQNGSGIVAPNWPIGLLALAGIDGVLSLGKSKPGLRAFVFGFLVFSFFCVCPGFYFRQHYFIVMLPVVALYAGVACRHLWEVATVDWRASFTITSAVMVVRWCVRFLRNLASRLWKVERRSIRRAAQGPTPVPTLSKERSLQQPEKSGRGSPRNQAKVVDRKRRSPKHEASVRNISASAPSAFIVSYVRMVAQALVVFVLSVAVLWPVAFEPRQRQFFFTWEPHLACRETYGSNPFLECPVIASYLQKNTTPEDTIAVLGSEPELFFDARRNSATGYIYTYGMMEPQPLARRMQAEMIEEIESARPQYIILVNVITSWLPQNNERLVFQWLEHYLPANYRRVGVADIVAIDHTEYLWDSRQEGYRPRSQANLLVFQRK